MQTLSLRPLAARWPVASALLLVALAGPAMAAATISGTVKVPNSYPLEQAYAPSAEGIAAAARRLLPA